jgi:hypothetical protein
MSTSLKRKRIMDVPDNLFDNHWWSKVPGAPPIEDHYPQINEPSNNIGNDPHIIEFDLAQPEHGYYIDQSDIKMVIQCSIVKSDGSSINHDPTQNAEGGVVLSPYLREGIPECNLIHSLFSDVRFSMNNVLVESTNGLHHYKQFLSTVLGCSSEESTNRLVLGLYDWNSYANDFKTVAANITRQNITKNSAVFTMLSQLNLDIQKQAKGFLPHCKLKLQFMLNPPSRYLYFTEGKGGKIKFHKFQIITKMVKMKDSSTVALMRRLQSESISYHIPSIHMSSFNLNKNIMEHEFHNVFTHILPNMCLITFVDNSAFLGSGTKSCFEFKHFNISHLSLHNQNVIYPRISGYNFIGSDFKEVYYQLFESLEIHDIYGLTLENMPNGRMVFAFDLTKTGHFPSNSYHELIPANTTIKVKWSNAPTENVTMIVYSFFEKTVSVDRFGQTIVLET